MRGQQSAHPTILNYQCVILLECAKILWHCVPCSIFRYTADFPEGSKGQTDSTDHHPNPHPQKHLLTKQFYSAFMFSSNRSNSVFNSSHNPNSLQLLVLTLLSALSSFFSVSFACLNISWKSCSSTEVEAEAEAL